MTKENEVLYAAFREKDPRYDGRFFVGIVTTGIYCRPVCRAKEPKAQNCTFFKTAAQAEKEGYRPCLLCRPELAPGLSLTDASTALAHRAAKKLEEICGDKDSLEDLALGLGCSDRHLRRVFMAEYKVSPGQYRQTYRLLLAKNLLTDTNLSVLQVAMAAGFGSLRRFNHLFKTHYHLSPTGLRKKRGEGEKSNRDIVLTLGYRPPYRWDEMMDFLKQRSIAGVEMVQNNQYMRTVCLNNSQGKRVVGWITVAHQTDKKALSLRVSETLVEVLPQVIARVRHLFDLYCDPHRVYEGLQTMNEMKQGVCTLGTRLPGCFNPFEMAVRAVLGQQITVKGAGTLAARMAASYGTYVNTGIEGLNRIFPLPQDILGLPDDIKERLGKLGIISARSNTIYQLALGLANEEIRLDLGSAPEEEMIRLMQIKGIGSWTAGYIAMRALGWTDAFLETDVGIKKALAPYSPKERLALAEKWRPWRSYATINLWNTV